MRGRKGIEVLVRRKKPKSGDFGCSPQFPDRANKGRAVDVRWALASGKPVDLIAGQGTIALLKAEHSPQTIVHAVPTGIQGPAADPLSMTCSVNLHDGFATFD